MKPTVLLIDSNALVHRAYHALPASMSTKDGEPTNAVYGFTMALLHAMETIKPTRIVCCFDATGPTFRHAEYHQYKATRKEMDKALAVQLPRIYEVVQAFGIPMVTKPGYEADDLIGTLAKQYEKTADVIILTGDRDELQLVSERTTVQMMKPGMNKFIHYTPALLKQQYGLEPAEFIVYKALRGDPSDNIPGVAGIGEISALKLVQGFHTLGKLYDAVNQDNPAIKDGIRAKLAAGKDLAYLSYRLSAIERDVPLDSVPDLETPWQSDRERVTTLFQELQFGSLFSRINLLKDTHSTTSDSGKSHRSSGAQKVVNIDEMVSIIDGAQGLMAVLVSYVRTALHAFTAHAISVSVDGKTGFAALIGESMVKQIVTALTHTQAHLAVWDAKATMHAFPGFQLRDGDADIMIQAGLTSATLGFTAQHKSDALDGAELESNALAARGLLHDAKLVHGQIESMKLGSVWHDIEYPLISVLYTMENAGITVDVSFLHQLSKRMNAEIASLEKSIHLEAGQEFNIASPQQLRTILFEKLALSTTGVKKKIHGYSTDVGTLEALQGSHPIIPQIMQYRELTKLHNTYIETLPALVDPKTGRIHTTYNQIGAATGRLSSNDPNLQNIPVRTEMGKAIRHSFVAEQGHVLLSLDYSQFELRILAHLSGDPTMIKHFKSGVDIHTVTAANVHDVPIESVTKEMRQSAKAINFGLMYGLSAHSLAKQLGIDYKQAEQFMERYFNTYKKVKPFLQSVIDTARRQGYYTTLYGRRRNFPELTSSVWAVKQAGERMAMNFPMQGTQADILKIAMIKVAALLKGHADAKLLLTVHDELVFEVKQDRYHKLTTTIQKTMETACTLDVPVVVSAAYGKNWGQMRNVEIAH